MRRDHAPVETTPDFLPTMNDLDPSTPTSVRAGIILVCALAYAIPATSFVGEMGSPPQVFAALIGVCAWAGLLLRRRLPGGWQSFAGGLRTEG
jgi:hypothetical protein